MEFRVRLSHATSSAVQVTATTVPGTALPVEDYQAQTRTLTIASGQREATFDVPLGRRRRHREHRDVHRRVEQRRGRRARLRHQRRGHHPRRRRAAVRDPGRAGSHPRGHHRHLHRVVELAGAGGGGGAVQLRGRHGDVVGRRDDLRLRLPPRRRRDDDADDPGGRHHREDPGARRRRPRGRGVRGDLRCGARDGAGRDRDRAPRDRGDRGHPRSADPDRHHPRLHRRVAGHRAEDHHLHADVGSGERSRRRAPGVDPGHHLGRQPPRHRRGGLHGDSPDPRAKRDDPGGRHHRGP